MFNVKYSFVAKDGERVHTSATCSRAELDNLLDLVELMDEMAYRLELVKAA